MTEDHRGHRLRRHSDALVSLEVAKPVFLLDALAKSFLGFLKPGGQLIVSRPYQVDRKNLAIAVTSRMHGHFTAPLDLGHLKYWSRKTLGHLPCEGGFQIDGLAGVGRVPLSWKRMIIAAGKSAR